MTTRRNRFAAHNESYRETGARTGHPAQELAYAIIEQAVTDVKLARRAGVIRNGEAVRRWPRNIPRCGIYGFRQPVQVQQTIDFFRRDLARLLDALGSTICPRAVCERLGIADGGRR